MEQRLYDAAAKLPATDAKLDTSQMTGKIRATNSIRRVVITLAACAAAMCMILFGALSLASSVKEYNDAVAYFSMHNLSTDGLSRKEIKDVYRDIITGSFTHPKTAGVLAGMNTTEPTGESEEILYCPAPMTKETYKRLFSTDSDDWDPATFWSEDNQNRNLRRYYGTYNGLDVMPQKIQIQSIETHTIAGFDFICNACNIMVKKDGGAGVTLQAAYERGLLTDEDIEAIYNYHKQTEAALYEEYATYYCPAPLTKQIYCQMFPSKAEYWNPDNFWSADSQSYLYRYYGMYNGYGIITQRTNIAVSQDYTTTIAGFTFITHSSHLFACKDGKMIYLDEAYEQGLLTQQDIESIYNYHMQVESTVPGQTDPEAEMLAQYFDLKKAHRPTFDEVLSIQEGTPVQDVVALLGKPHGFAPSHNWATFWWETAEGHAVLVDLRSTKDFPLDGGIPSAVENYFKYCVVDWVVPLVEMDTPLDNIGEAYDEAALYNAVNKYFSQRAFYLRWLASTIANVVPGIVEDEHTHRAAIDAAGIEWLSSDVVIHGIAYWDSHAQVVATETVTYRENGVEKTAAILHRLQLSGENDEGKISTGADMYFEAITGFCSSSYLPPWYETPQPYSTEPYGPSNPTDPTDPTDPSEPTDSTEPTDYPDLTEPTGPASPTAPTEPYDPSEPTGPDITEPTEPYPEPSFEDPVTLTWCIPDSNGMYSYQDLDRIIAAINEITQREINTTIRLEVIPVGEYTEAMSMKYMAAERWDICFSGMWNNYKDAVMQGAFVELPVDMLQAYAPDLMETLNPAALEALKIQGEVYALPVQWLHAQQSGLLFDTELAEKLGFDWRSVKKLEDLEPYFDMLLANGYTECISLDPWQMMNYLQSYFGFDYLHSYAIPAAVRVSDQNGTVINPYETEEFKAFARLMYKWYNKGYFTDEILSGSSKSRPVTLYPITGSGEQWQFGFAGQMVPLGQAVMTTEQVRSATLAISCYCKNPERAVAFINLLTTNEELLNLVTYGQEGIDWNWVDEDDKVIQREEYAYPGTYAMMVGNDCLDYYLDPQLVGGNETIRKINADARTSAILGFQYDATKMAGHMANIQVAADGLIRSIMCGMAGDPDVAIAKLNADLYAAGLQQVLDDMQSQVDAWKASQ